MTEAIALHIEGMTCASCAVHVKKALEQVPGVRSAAVSYPKGRAEITTDARANTETLTAAEATLGYRAGAADMPVEPVSMVDKALGWLGGSDKLSANGGTWHLAVVGRGGVD